MGQNRGARCEATAGESACALAYIGLHLTAPKIWTHGRALLDSCRGHPVSAVTCHSARINVAKRIFGFSAHEICAGREETMKLISLMIAGAALACSWTGSASAQQAVRPQWNY